MENMTAAFVSVATDTIAIVAVLGAMFYLGYITARSRYRAACEKMATRWEPNTRNHKRADQLARMLEGYCIKMYNSCDESKVRRIASLQLADYEELILGAKGVDELIHNRALTEAFERYKRPA